MKKSIIAGFLSLTIFLGFGITAQAQGVSLQQLVQLLITLGLIAPNKVAAAEAAINMTPSSASASQSSAPISPSLSLASAEQSKSLGTGTFTVQGKIAQLLSPNQLTDLNSRYLNYVGTLTSSPYVVVIQDTTTLNSQYEAYFIVSAGLFKTLSVGDVLQVTGQFGGGFNNIQNDNTYLTKYISVINNQITLVSHKSSQYSNNGGSIVTTTINGVSFIPLAFSSYQNNSSNYLGQKITVPGYQDSFIPQAGYGTSNFIEIQDPLNSTNPKIELEVDNSNAYSQAVEALTNNTNPTGLLLRAYGTAVPPQSFTQSTIFGTRTVNVPVINVSEIDQCLAGTSGGFTTVAIDSGFTCTMWSSITGSSNQ